MTYVVKDELRDCFLLFNTFVRDMDIVSVASPRKCPKNATPFSTEEKAKQSIEDLKNCNTYNTVSHCVVCDLDALNKANIEEHKRLSNEIIRNAWENTSKKKKKQMLDAMNEKERKEFLDKVNQKEVKNG